MDTGTQGGSGVAVPGFDPTSIGGTPPTFPSPGAAEAPVDEMTKRLLTALTQAATQRRAAGQPRPTAVPGQVDANQPPEYMTRNANPHAWGAQRLMYGVQSMIRNAVNKHKEDQITKAMGDWEYGQSALNEYYAAQASGDQQAMAAAQKKLDFAFGDPKKLKNMAKALNQDWLNPEKTTPYGEALKRVAAQTQQKDAQKQQAKAGITGIFQKLIQKAKGAQQPPLTDEDKKGIEQEIINRAPTTPGGFDVTKMKDVAELEKAMVDARQKYQYIPAADGTIWAVNKNDRTDSHKLIDADTKEEVKGKAAAKEGQLYALPGGMPIGVFHNGKPVTPDDPLWSDADQKLIERAMGGIKEKQFLRVAPEIAAIVGDPPDPGKFKGGRSDPEYAKELKTWGDAVFKKETEKAGAAGTARAIAMNQYRPVQVMDDDGHVYYTTAAKAIAEGFSGAGEGIKLKSRQAQIGDIETASKNTRSAIEAVDKPFSPAQIAKLKFALSTDDASMANTQMKALASEDLTEKQQDFVIWVSQLNERAMALRSVAGVGQGSEGVREAIRATLPGIGSGNKQMMGKQLDAFDQQVKVLKGGIATPGKGGGEGGGTQPKVGETKTFPNGAVGKWDGKGWVQQSAPVSK